MRINVKAGNQCMLIFAETIQAMIAYADLADWP